MATDRKLAGVHRSSGVMTGLLGGGRREDGAPSSPGRDGPVSVNIERPAMNKRKISADVVVHAPLEIVWTVLNDYGSLSDYIPNLAMSELRPHPNKAGIRVEQAGVQSILGFQFRASVTMDMVEVNHTSAEWRAIEFSLVESRDFAHFSGTWRIDRSGEDPHKTVLAYDVSIVPKGLVPVKAIEWRISVDVPQNMEAVKRECESRRRRASIAAARRARVTGDRGEELQ